MSKAERKLLDQQNWGELYAQLVLFVLKKYGGNDPARVVAPGFSLEDAIMQAFKETIDGPRYWDPAKYPKIYFHLRYAVWSIISDRLDKLESRKTVIWQPSDPDDDRTEDEILSSMGAISIAETLKDASEHDGSYSQTAGEIVTALDGEPILEKLYYLIEGGLPPREIATQMNLSVIQIYNLKKLLIRRLKNNPYIANLVSTRHPKVRKDEIQ